MLDKIKEILLQIPVVNLIPVLISMANDFPKRWESLPDDKKQQFFEAMIAAGTKAAANYAKSSS